LTVLVKSIRLRLILVLVFIANEKRIELM